MRIAFDSASTRGDCFTNCIFLQTYKNGKSTTDSSFTMILLKKIQRICLYFGTEYNLALATLQDHPKLLNKSLRICVCYDERICCFINNEVNTRKSRSERVCSLLFIRPAAFQTINFGVNAF